MWLKIYQAMITMGGCTSGHVLTPNQFKKRLKYLAALGFVMEQDMLEREIRRLQILYQQQRQQQQQQQQFSGHRRAKIFWGPSISSASLGLLVLLLAFLVQVGIL
ncbi:unnamed protein product, partial [Vitis vinifera]|uniref:Uncharacterized protein n=1 Tax=Vitis vinifera TaxID=29760 RepID=D7TYG1_VITVI